MTDRGAQAEAEAVGGAPGARSEPPTDVPALLPKSVRRWVVGGLTLVVGFAIYVLGVRGEVVLNGLAAVAAYCF